MKMILLVNKIIEKISVEWRIRLFREKAHKCGSNCSIYGKIYQINPNVSVGDNVKIYPGVQFFGDGNILIGDNVSIGNNTLIYASKGSGVYIGNDTQIAALSYIIDTNHGIKKGDLIRCQKNDSKKVVIGSDVWIGTNVTVLKGSEIGSGTVIGAKSLVNSVIESNCIAFGSPAKKIKNRE